MGKKTESSRAIFVQPEDSSECLFCYFSCFQHLLWEKKKKKAIAHKHILISKKHFFPLIIFVSKLSKMNCKVRTNVLNSSLKIRLKL